MRANFATTCKLQTFRDHGPALSPLSALMILSDLRTLRHRVDNFSRNAMEVAAFLQRPPRASPVSSTRLESAPTHELARASLWLVDGDQCGVPVNQYSHLLSFRTR